MQYESPVSYCLKVMAKVNILTMQADVDTRAITYIAPHTYGPAS